MGLTIILAATQMAGLFLMLLSGVALIQDKRLFTSAPKDIQAAIRPRAERFPGARALGWGLMVVALAALVGAGICVML